MDGLLAQLAGMGGGGGMGGGRGADDNTPLRDTAETTHISSLALLKMLTHARAGVPLEVMGLMIGEYIDDYTVRVVDVFSMPQTATGQSVEAVDPEYQSLMLEKLEQVGRPEKVVGWYHSHPGFGCWLSSEDVQTAKSYEQLTSRSVSVVIDPIQSVPGKVVIDAFRTIPQEISMLALAGQAKEVRQTTSNLGFMTKPSITALVHGLNKTFYNMPIAYRKNKSEVHLLRNVRNKSWREGLKVETITEHEKTTRNESIIAIKKLVKQSEKFIASGKDEDDVGNVGRIIPTTHLLQEAESLISANLNYTIGIAVNSLIF
eukprot:TRINITY_DN5265_c0_g1_i1.p1 TRINITY_DN5265_c0_g1~~TRINITY_DN5265_c0_g1_i1.p1  ORF type:complete len:317 (+),score=84.84 TRINITY_DN5265_c0_g1_i1:274-1224(+)